MSLISELHETTGAASRQLNNVSRPEIRQPHPFHCLLSISKSVRALTALSVEAIGLSVGQDQFLEALDPEAPATVSELCAALNVRPSTVSKMCDRLSQKGFVERRVCHSDARRTIVSLTEAGQLKRREVLKAWDQVQAGLVKSYPALDDPEVRDLLSSVDSILLKRLSRLR